MPDHYTTLLPKVSRGSRREAKLQPWRTGYSNNTSGGSDIVVTTNLYQMLVICQQLRSELHVQPRTGSYALQNKQDSGMWKWERAGILIGRLQNSVRVPGALGRQQ